MNTKPLRKYRFSFLKQPSFYFISLFILMNLIFTKQMMPNSGILKYLLVAAIELFIEIALLLCIRKMRKKALPLEKQFLLVSIILGLFFIIVMPPGQAPDEGGHFMRAYGIAEGKLIPDVLDPNSNAVGSEIPVETSFILAYGGMTDDRGAYQGALEDLWLQPSGETTPQPYNTAAVYNFVCYLPQAIGVLIGKIFSTSVLMMAYLAEIFNFALFVVIIYFAIKLIPKYKTAVFFIALLPITIQEATSIAPDALSIALSIFTFSYALHLSSEAVKNIAGKHRIIMFVTAIVLSLCKIVYAPIVLSYLIIPKEKFGTKQKNGSR